jgi:hypothetical protein
MYFSEAERLTLRDEVVHFMSGIATVIQDLSSTMDDVASECSSSRLRYYQIVISDLMHVSGSTVSRSYRSGALNSHPIEQLKWCVHIVETE